MEGLGRGMYGGPQCLGKRLKSVSKKQGVMAGSIAEASGRGNGLLKLVWKWRAGRVVWEGQEDRSPGDQLGGLAATRAQEIRA